MNLRENKKTNWGYILVIGILAALVGAGTLTWQYWWPPIQNDVNGIQITKWKTFTNTELGFSFKYPAEWGEVEERIWDAQEEKAGMSGKGYTLLFTNIDYGENSISADRVYGTGRSKDFSAGRGKWLEDYYGEPNDSRGIVSTTLSIRSYAVPSIINIDFNLPGKEIGGVRLFVPILSQDDIGNFNEKCSSMSPEEKQGICVYGDTSRCLGEFPEECRYVDTPVEVNKYLEKLKKEPLDSDSQKKLYIFEIMLDSSKVF